MLLIKLKTKQPADTESERQGRTQDREITPGQLTTVHCTSHHAHAHYILTVLITVLMNLIIIHLVLLGSFQDLTCAQKVAEM